MHPATKRRQTRGTEQLGERSAMRAQGPSLWDSAYIRLPTPKPPARGALFSFQLPQTVADLLVGVGEDNRPEDVAVDGAVGGDDMRAESLGNGRGRFGAGGCHPVREVVGDQARDAVLPELIQNVALAGSRSARQRDSDHQKKSA